MAKAIKKEGITALPFVVDVPHPQNSRRTMRRFWSAPVTADYGEACEIGRQWAAEYINYARGNGGGSLVRIMRDMGEWDRGLPDGSEATGFAVGFLSTIERLAEHGAAGWGGADKFIDAQNEHYRSAQRKRDAEERERALAAVARMNAGRAAKRALGKAAAI